MVKIKEEKLLFRRVMVFIAAMFWLNVATFLYNYGNFSQGLTGFSVADTITTTVNEMSGLSKIFLAVQWIFLILLVIFISIRDAGVKSTKKELKGVSIQKVNKRSGTDLDSLYDILKKRKQLKISTICKLFKIKKETAMNWCKILESGNLAVIDYSGLGEPIVKLIK